jgi:hypothetical protein
MDWPKAGRGRGLALRWTCPGTKKFRKEAGTGAGINGPGNGQIVW